MSCNYPKFVIIVLVPQNLFMFALFLDFYIKAYVKKKPKVKDTEQVTEGSPSPSSTTTAAAEESKKEVKTD